jgi:hypothetical protein
MEPKKNESLFTKLKRKCLADSSSSIAPTPAVGGVEKPAIFLQEEGEEGPGRRIERSNTWRLETGTSNGVSIFKYRLSKGPESILAKKIFIPPSKLRMLVSRDVVERVLEKVYKSYKGERRLRMTDYVKRVWDPPPPNGKSWLKVFTLLYLIQEHDSTILQWIDHDIGDQDLPIRSSELEESEIGRRLKRLLDSLERNRQWGQREMANLDEYQEQLFVPFLTRQPSEIPHKDFVDETILPFVEPDDAKKPKPNNLEGGYGEVIGVEVPSCCYDFKKLFEAQGVWSLKSTSCSLTL